MNQLAQALADAHRWDLNPVSKYHAPFAFRAYGTIADDNTVPCCAMETLCVAMGDPPAGVHPEVNPILSAIVRTLNDAISKDEPRTRILWPYLPQLIGTGERSRQWENDLYVMIVDRELSILETSGLLNLSAETVSFVISADLDNRRLGSTKLTDLLRYAVRTYWDSRPGAQAPDDFTPRQYFRVQKYAQGLAPA